MSAIIIPRRHLAQPQGRVTLSPEWAGSIRGAFRPEGGAWVDDAAGLIYQGTATTPTASPLGVAGQFNGSTSGVNLGNRSDLFSGAALTIELLIQASAASIGDLVRKQLFSKDSASGREINIQIGDDAAGMTVPGGLSFAFFNSGQVTQTAQVSGQGVIAGQVAHLAFTCRPSLGALGVAQYLNGFAVDRTSMSSTAAAVGATSTDLYIGRRVYSGYEEPFEGAIYGVWCHGRELPAEEVRARADAPFSIYRADPIRIYSMPSGPITLGTPSITNITSSGFRVAVGLS